MKKGKQRLVDEVLLEECRAREGGGDEGWGRK
jgi:hypothetical protein